MIKRSCFFKITSLQESIQRFETNLKEDFKVNREESAVLAKENRTELNESLKEISSTLAKSIESLILKVEEKSQSQSGSFV